MNYEYKCPLCGFINIKYSEYARIVCSSCGQEFEPNIIYRFYYKYQIPSFPNYDYPYVKQPTYYIPETTGQDNLKEINKSRGIYDIHRI